MTEAGWWLVVGVGVAVGDGLLFWLGYTWHGRRRQTPSMVEGKVDPTALRQDIDRFNAALNAIQLCITGVEEKVGRLQTAVPAGRPQASAPQTSDLHAPAPRPVAPDSAAEAGWQDEVVRIAQRLARLGANASELSRACNIPPGEAELISRLTRLGGAARSASFSSPGGEDGPDARPPPHSSGEAASGSAGGSFPP